MSGWDDQLPPRDRSEAQEWRPTRSSGGGWVDVRSVLGTPFPDAKGILERLQAICQERVAAGDRAFLYRGMEGWIDPAPVLRQRRQVGLVGPSAEERVRAICRQRFAAGDKAFSYPGIVEDIAAEKAEPIGANRVPGQEG